MIRKQGIAISKIVLFVLFAVLFMTSVQSVRVYAKSQDVTKTISEAEKIKMHNTIAYGTYQHESLLYFADFAKDGNWDGGEYYDFTKKADIQRLFRLNNLIILEKSLSFSDTIYVEVNGEIFSSEELTKKLYGKAVKIKDGYESDEDASDSVRYAKLKRIVKKSEKEYQVDEIQIQGYPESLFVMKKNNSEEFIYHKERVVSYYLEKSDKSLFGYYLKKIKYSNNEAVDFDKEQKISLRELKKRWYYADIGIEYKPGFKANINSWYPE